MTWRPIDDDTPTDELHVRGHWVRHLLPDDKSTRIWQVFLGRVNDSGDFVSDGDDDSGWAADDYTHWVPVELPAAPDTQYGD